MNQRILNKYLLSFMYKIIEMLMLVIYKLQLRHVNTRNIIYSNISI